MANPRPDPGLRDNPPPQVPNQKWPAEENNAILGLSFPRKLWRIVEDRGLHLCALER